MKHVIAAALLLALAVPTAPGAAGAAAPPAPTAAAQAPAPAPRKVDLNRATAAELESVPGIGERLAQAIIALRERNGSFAKLDELLEVRGIGEKSLAALAEHLAVVPASTPAAAAKLSPAK